MRKETQHLRGGLAAAAVCSILIFGCSSNHTPGDGQPSTSPPMTPAATPGSSSGTTNPPMASAMDLSNQVQRSVDAQAIAAAHQRERFLGYINPAGPQPTPPEQMPVTGQVIPPSQYANPEVTVNSSISSGPNPVITSGLGDGGATTFVAAPATVPAATTGTGTTSASVATPTTAALTATPGQFAAGASTTATTAASTTVANTAALTPTLTSSLTASPTRAANPPLASVGVTASTSATQTSQTSTTAAPSAATGRLVIANGATISSGTVRAVTNASGAITVTNIPAVIKNK
jgi:hypothetical protein